MASNTHRSFCGRTRREFLWETGCGFGAAALASLLSVDGFFAGRADAATQPVNPLAPRASLLPAKAKSVIFLFMYGGPSHIDTFDYKPTMVGMDGKTIDVKTFGRGGKKNQGRIVEPRWRFRPRGECGKYVSDLFPHLGDCVDDIAFLHSMTAESPSSSSTRAASESACCVPETMRMSSGIAGTARRLRRYWQTASRSAGRPSVGGYPRSV